jgi:hypothetical protein
MRNTELPSNPDDVTAYKSVINRTETKWLKVPNSKNLWAPAEVINKSIHKDAISKEWFISATWKYDALKVEDFDAEKFNADIDGNAFSKLRRELQTRQDATQKGSR